MMRVLALVLVLVGCDDDDELPTCPALGCTGPLLCSSTMVCRCNGEDCRPVVVDAGPDSQ